MINHSLLFSSLGLENSILTNLNNLVIDEAHNIEDTVTDSLKEDYNRKSLIEFFGRIEKIFTLKNIEQIDFLLKKDKLIKRLDILEDCSNSYLTNNTKEENQYKIILVRDDYFDEIS
ncbi:MAG: hypothetical protein LBQ24_07195 [Candidatus Peribacteria bacterium]|nr:hypothetical protein [Candidatus Peribacteria bacterium]